MLALYSIVAVHGLGGDSIKTWTHPKSNAFWLKDFLPEQLPDARIMTFSYNATMAFGKSASDVIDHAKGLLSSLVDKREESEVRISFRLPSYDGKSNHITGERPASHIRSTLSRRNCSETSELTYARNVEGK